MRTYLILLSSLALAVSFAPVSTAQAGRVAATPAFTGKTPRVKTGAPAVRPQTVRPSIKIGDAVTRPTPHVAVDDAGTAYITWLLATDPTSGAEGGIGFCRLPRGASACDNPPATRVLQPGKGSYGPGDDPAYNQDAGGGAFPLVLGDQLFILSTRSVTTYATPAGDSTNTTIAFVSTDGGSSFSAGQPVAADLVLATRPVAFGPTDNPLIGLFGATGGSLAGGGTAAFTALQGGAFATDRIAFPSATSGALAALPGGGIAVGYGSPSGAAVQRAAAATRPTGPESFTAPQKLPGGTTLDGLGTGPKGLTAVAIGGATPALNQRVVASPLDGGGAPVALTQDSALPPVLAVAGDTPGRALAVGYVDVGDPTSANGLYVRRTADGTTYTTAERLTKAGEGVFATDVAAAPDGGGVAVWQSEDFGGEVRANVFGPQGKLAGPGLPGTAPGAGSGSVDDGGVTRECRRVAVGAVQVTTADGVGCFLPTVGKDKGKSVSNGPVLYNGLRITPLGGSQIVLDVDTKAKSVTLYTTKDARVEIPGNEAGDITIFQGQLKQKLTAKVGEPALDLPKYPATVRGFKVANALAPIATKGFGVRIPADFDLGPQFFGLTAHGELVVTPDGGLQLETLKFSQKTLPLGPIVIEDLAVSWTRSNNLWAGSGKVTLPAGARLSLQVLFDSTSFSAFATYDLPFPGIQLFASPPVYLHQISAGLDVNRNKIPLKVTGGVQVGAVPVAPGVYLLDLSGQLALTFGNPFVIEVRGDLEILSALNAASASLRVGSDGIARASFDVGAIDRDFAYVGVKATAAVGAAGFEGKGTGEVCVGIKLVGVCKDLPQGYVSTKGMAGCVSIGDVHTVVYPWGGPVQTYSGDSCYYDPISIGLLRAGTTFRGTRLRQAASTLTVPPGAKKLTVNVASAAGAPVVDLVDPDNELVPQDGVSSTFSNSERAHAAIVEVPAPKAGRYAVVARAGSPAVTSVTAGVPAPKPTVKASVSKASRTGARTVTFSVAGNPRATVALVERTRAGDVPLKGGGRSGKLTFRPNALVAGRHQLVARVSSGDGFVLDEQVVASFMQPTPKGPARPRRVRVRRSGSAVLVSVTRGRGAASRLIVSGRYGDGARASAVISAKGASARLPLPAKSLNAPGPLRVTVTAISGAGVRGGSRGASLGVRGSQRAPRKRR